MWGPFARQQAAYLIMDECHVDMKSESIQAIQNCGTFIFISMMCFIVIGPPHIQATYGIIAHLGGPGQCNLWYVVTIIFILLWL